MQTIDIQKIAHAKGLLLKDLAKVLFPKTKYPYLAIRRIMRGEAFLNSEQVLLFRSLPIFRLTFFSILVSGNCRLVKKL